MADAKDGNVPSEPPPSYEKSSTKQVAIAPPRQGGPRPGPKPLDIPILRHLRTKRVVLASASPRRKALLGMIGLTNLEIRPSTKPEDIDKASHTADEYVSATAHQKCLDVYAALVDSQASSSDPEPCLVLAADTVVVARDGRILEKPRDRADHLRMLRLLRDTRSHRVLTAVVALSPREDARSPGYEVASHVEDTSVFFVRESEGLPDDVLEAYVDTREGCDKAGGYALQGIAGSILVEKVEGSVDNVVGLPVRRCLELAEKVVFKQHVETDEEDDDEE